MNFIKKFLLISTAITFMFVSTIFPMASTSSQSTTNTIPNKPSTSYTNDIANMLAKGTENNVDERNTQISDKGIEIFVASVNGTGEDSGEDFAKKIFYAWEIGGEKAKGILLLLVKNEFEDSVAGYYALAGEGMDSYFGDEILYDLIKKNVEPLFAENNYDDAVDAFTKCTVEAITGKESLVTGDIPETDTSINPDDKSEDPGFFAMIWEGIKFVLTVTFIIIIVVIIAFVLLNIRAQNIRKKRRAAKLQARRRVTKQEDL